VLRLLIVGVAVAASGLPTSTASSYRAQRQPRAGSCHARGSGLYSLPDPHCTPGAIDPAVTQADIGRTICVSGYTEKARPPEYITEAAPRTDSSTGCGPWCASTG
jgi:hypothetical protein